MLIRNMPEYRVWTDMKQRCLNPNNKRYKDYGGRGIKVCNEWINSFENFYRDMGPRPTKDHSIERKENNGDYCQNNCYWATWKEQYSNRRTNHKIEFNGEKLTITEWANRLQMHPSSLFGRLKRTNNVKEILKHKKCHTSSYKGVSFDKDSNRWRAVIYQNGKQIYIGRFKSEIEACQAYNQKEKEIYDQSS